MYSRFQLNRRALLQGAGATVAALALGGLSSRMAYAAAPSELDVIIGFAPGGGTDRSVRLIADPWARAMQIGNPVNYTYAPGAGTVIATNQLLQGRKDGSVVQGIPVPYTAWTLALEQGGYSAEDLAWIGGYFDDPNVVLVPKDSPYNSIGEFIEAAKKSEMTVAVSAPMSASHAATVVLRELTGAQLRVVPFDGGSQSRNAVAGGHVDACMAPYWSATHVLEQTKAIGIFADANPAPELWQPVPINDELDVEVPDLTEPYAMQMASEAASQNPETYETLVSTFRDVVTSEEVREAAAANQSLDLFLNYRSPEDCQQWLTDYLALLDEFRPAMERDLDSL
jgi:putative tricarboxylic transport membrane protein